MITLAFDCSTGPTSVAIATDVTLLAHITDDQPRGQAEHLLPMIDQAVRAAGIDWPAIDRIAVTLGPGSFTGVRIGLAAAKGLALALNRPVSGFSTLEAMAADLTGADLTGTEPLAIAVDARRGEIYGQCFAADGQPLDAPEALTPAAFAARLTGDRWRIAGSGATLVVAAALDASRLAIIADRKPDATQLIALISRRPTAASAVLEPLYLRAPDAIAPI